MGLFDELDIAGADENPFAVPDNTYACTISKVERKETSKKTKGLFITYKVTEGEHSGKTITEFKRIPSPSDPVDQRLSQEDIDKARSYIKLRLIALGVPDEKMNTIEPDDLIGVDCYVTVKTKGEYQNVQKVTTGAPEGFSAESTAAGNPFASL